MILQGLQALPSMPRYVALPGWLGTWWIWNKLWAVAVLCSASFAVALLLDLFSHDKKRVGAILFAGVLFQTIYYLHHVPLSSRIVLVERWSASVASLITLFVSVRSQRQENIAPAIETLAGAMLAATFVAGPSLMLALSLSLLTLGIWILQLSNSNTADKAR